MLKQTEKEIQNAILQFLAAKKIFAWSNQSVGIFDPARKVYRKSHNPFAINGTSDILGIVDGKFLAIEVKTPQNKKRTEDQNNFIKNINDNGGIGFYATSIEDVKRELGL